MIYWKWWIWKSTVSAHLSAYYAINWYKVLQVWCDPKHDSTKRLLPRGVNIKTVIDISKYYDIDEITKDMFIYRWKYWVDCIESGWPFAGIWCAWRWISLMFEIFEETNLLNSTNYDVVIFDVLGDVVCWWFASPLKVWFADSVFIVTSEEIMSVYAANNISRAVVNYSSNWVRLWWLILNRRSNSSDISWVQMFAESIWTNILWTIERSEELLDAEKEGKTVFDLGYELSLKEKYSELAEKIYNSSKWILPTPFEDEEFDSFVFYNFKK